MKNNKKTFVFIFILSLIIFYLFNRSAGIYQEIPDIDETFLSKISLTIDNLFSEIRTKPFKIYLDKYSLLFGLIGMIILGLTYLYNAFGRNNYLVGTEHGSAK